MSMKRIRGESMPTKIPRSSHSTIETSAFWHNGRESEIRDKNIRVRFFGRQQQVLGLRMNYSVSYLPKEDKNWMPSNLDEQFAFHANVGCP